MTRTKFTRTLNTDVSSASDDPVSRGNSTAGEVCATDRNGVTVTRNSNGDVAVKWADNTITIMQAGSGGAYMWSAFLRHAVPKAPDEGEAAQ